MGARHATHPISTAESAVSVPYRDERDMTAWPLRDVVGSVSDYVSCPGEHLIVRRGHRIPPARAGLRSPRGVIRRRLHRRPEPACRGGQCTGTATRRARRRRTGTARRSTGDLDPDRAAFVGAHLRALECSARKFAGDDIGFVDEVRAYFDVDIEPEDPAIYRAAHAELAAVLGVPGSSGEALAAAMPAIGVPTRSRRSGSTSACVPSAAHCVSGCAPPIRCPTPRSSTSRWSPTSRGRDSTTTSATIAPEWRSTSI